MSSHKKSWLASGSVRITSFLTACESQIHSHFKTVRELFLQCCACIMNNITKEINEKAEPF